METLLMILIVVVIVCLLGGFYFLFLKKEAKPAEVPMSGSLVSARTGPGQKLVATFELDMNEFMNNDPVPFSYELEHEILEQRDDFDVFCDVSASLEERCEAGERLREAGYQVRIPPVSKESPAVSAPAAKAVPVKREVDKEDDDWEEEEEDLSVTRDVQRLEAVLYNPYSDAEQKEVARRRLSELGWNDGEAAPGHEPEPEPEPVPGMYGMENDFYGEEPELEPVPMEGPDFAGGDDPVEDYGSEEVDPVTHEPLARSVPAAPAAPAAPVVPSSFEDDGGDITFRMMEGYDEAAEDSEKVIRLMRFIARSFRARLISPELVLFAEKRFHLQVNRDFWSASDRERASQRVVVYERDSKFQDMTTEEFDGYVGGVVEKERIARQERIEEERRRSEEEKAELRRREAQAEGLRREEEDAARARERQAIVEAERAAAAEREAAERLERERKEREERELREAAERERVAREKADRERAEYEEFLAWKRLRGASGAAAGTAPAESPVETAPEVSASVVKEEPAVADVHSVEAAEEEAGREAVRPAPAVEEPAPEPAPVEEAPKDAAPAGGGSGGSRKPAARKPVTTFFDRYGGKDDLMWQRLERGDNNKK